MKPEETRILIVDDEYSARDSLTKWFQVDGYQVDSAKDAYEALEKLKSKMFDIVLLDIKMPGMDGLELQEHIRELDPNIVIIIITAFASVDTAIRAIKAGAYDYVTKPFDPDDLEHIIENAMSQRKLAQENIQLRAQIEELVNFDEIIGETPQMKRVLDLVRTVAQTDSTVLIRGESGTGKELIARAVHFNSPRRNRPLISINCGAFSESLLESELFGYEKGAFTGATKQYKGKIEIAEGGTLFLDEIGDISPKTQLNLLRVLETKKLTRLGGEKEIAVDFRLITATNRDLEEAIREGKFREDLYYRLNVFTIFLPPLRERSGDIPLLANHFLKKYAAAIHKNIESISPSAMDLLMNYPWPGNIRELENAIERAVVICKGNQIEPEHLPLQQTAKTFGFSQQALEAVEKEHIQRILQRTGWNVTQAAKILKIDRVTLYNKIKRYGFKREEE
ncbi:MAG: sigma-54-dependent Fis family transcriptional regulator [Calditrichaeota bacterium]|nr:sigma-54-dependent Fis family transcriptional regulator [Calditrichota bacterium]